MNGSLRGLIQNQVQRKYTSTFQTIWLVTKEEGFWRLYRGLITPMVTVAFYNSVTFGVYASVLRQLPNDDDTISGAKMAAKHGLAGMVAGFARVNKG